MANLDEDLTLEQISRVSGVSKYHFHRIFTAHMGISIYSYIKMARLKRASYQLVFSKELKVIDIALGSKYESPEAFSREFKKSFGINPLQFRNTPDWKLWYQKYTFKQLSSGGKGMKVEIINMEKTKIAVLEYKGDPKLLNNVIPKFIEWRKESGESPINSHKTFGLVYNDPNNTPAEDFRFDICGELKNDLRKNTKGIIQKEIPKGRYAVLRHVGSHDSMEDKIYYLYRDWLPLSGEKLRDFPLFFQYQNFFPEVSEAELITDIFLSLE